MISALLIAISGVWIVTAPVCATPTFVPSRAARCIASINAGLQSGYPE